MYGIWVVVFAASVLACLLGPPVLSFRGLGSRGKWLGAGIGGLIALLLFEFIYRRAAPDPHFRPEWDYVTPPLGGVERLWFVLTVGFILAAACFRPKKDSTH
jgi:hypothetical protein